MPLLQELIYKLEEGRVPRLLRVCLLSGVALLLVIGYNARAYKNFATQEAMDMAQVGRNIAEGSGYSTLFIRPFSIYLLNKHNADQKEDRARVNSAHPDLSNPPVYPTILAGLLKVFRPEYNVSKGQGFWKWNYQAEFLIALFNQGLLLGVVVLTFFLARRLFDKSVAWLSAIVLVGTELLWRFSVSGLPTLLLMLIFLGLLSLLLFVEESAREAKNGQSRVLVAALGAGLLTGIGGLTHYSFGWLIFPVIVFLALFGGTKKTFLAILAATAFLLIMGPWVARNYQVSGTPFGTASYAPIEDTLLFPQDKLEHSLHPNFSSVPRLFALWRKFGENAQTVVQEDLPKLGGSWLVAFFAVSVMVVFRNAGARRIRGLLLSCLGIFVLTQIMARTHLSNDSPVINTENLLVLLTPMVIVYGVALFYLLLDQVELPVPQMRHAVLLLFGLLACLPMIQVFLPPQPKVSTFPPYYAPGIQFFSGPFKPTELTMSDIPWAVAWYGQRQCAGLTLKSVKGKTEDLESREDLSELSQQCGKTVQGLLLSPVTLGRGFREMRTSFSSWGGVVLLYALKDQVPLEFTLVTSPKRNFFPDMLMLAEYDRWKE